MKVFNSVFVYFLIVLLANCTKENVSLKKNQIQIPPPKILASEMKTDDKGLSELKAILKTASGDIVIKFYPQKAPKTVTRIVQLIEMGFYNNASFHRVEQNYLVQTGDPTGTGRGGSGYKLEAEFNDIPHKKGTVAMARAMDIDSADSQFYITLTPLPHLDGKYTVFGQVIAGEDLLSKINLGDKILTFTIEK